MSFPSGSAGKESTHLQCGKPGFDPWVGKISWRRERLSIPVFWPEEFHGLYSPWSHKESETTEQLSLSESSTGKESICNAGDLGSIPVLGRSPGGGMATHSSILAWRIPWTEEPGGLQSMGLQRVGHNWTHIHTNTHIHREACVFGRHLEEEEGAGRNLLGKPGEFLRLKSKSKELQGAES